MSILAAALAGLVITIGIVAWIAGAVACIQLGALICKFNEVLGFLVGAVLFMFLTFSTMCYCFSYSVKP